MVVLPAPMGPIKNIEVGDTVNNENVASLNYYRYFTVTDFLSGSWV
jgi:hypothetical protein